MPHTNALINESSPYLLQHAYNPVNWYPWGAEALQKAKSEDKPILVSIGYAACHWCHVMEHECFENQDLAELMNEFFVCIKVDREERPDIDDIYMNAVQLMGQHGGWPLNVFLTPEQKPFYGGTYFQPHQWHQVLIQINKAFHERRTQIDETANKVAQGISANQSFNIKIDQEQSIKLHSLDKAFQNIAKRFDTHNGGLGNAPKFPMPKNYDFLLNYYTRTIDEKALHIATHTLNKMANGGIYDQIGGGFSRYSVDERWLVPHFEKMLYDNAQLISLYSNAYKHTKNPLYKSVVYETIAFCERELKGSYGNYYASLDADSEGEEGKFYVWTFEELQEILKTDFVDFCKIYNIQKHGNWEGNTILERTENPISDQAKLFEWKALLLNERSKRIRPGLDDKTLAGWNGLMLKGLCEAYQAFGEEKFRTAAIENAQFIEKHLISKGKLYRNFKNGNHSIDGFLEDYATVAQGFIELYQITFNEHWITLATTLTEYANSNFFDPEDGFYFFTDKNSTELIARRKDIQDNVIPSSNSIMAHNLYLLGHFLSDEALLSKAKNMTLKMETLAIEQSSFMSNWANLLFLHENSTIEIAIIGKDADLFRKELQKHPLGNVLYLGDTKKISLPLGSEKTILNNVTTLYICVNKTCQKPVNTIEEALKQINELH